MMINKRLIGAVTESKKYIAGNAIVQWLSLIANVCMMGGIAKPDATQVELDAACPTASTAVDSLKKGSFRPQKMWKKALFFGVSGDPIQVYSIALYWTRRVPNGMCVR